MGLGESRLTFRSGQKARLWFTVDESGGFVSDIDFSSAADLTCYNDVDSGEIPIEPGDSWFSSK